METSYKAATQPWQTVNDLIQPFENKNLLFNTMEVCVKLRFEYVNNLELKKLNHLSAHVDNFNV